MNLIVKNTVNTCVYGIIHVLTKYWCQLKNTNKMYHIIDMSPFLLRRNRDQMIE